MPARIVGRDAELAAIREAVRRATASEVASPTVFFGARGMGKTVLLHKLRKAADSKTISVPLETLTGRTLTERLREKVDALLADSESLTQRAASGLRGAMTATPFDHDSLAAMLSAMQTAAKKSGRYLTITVDEVQDADILSMQRLAAFVHESGQSGQPIVLGLAGLRGT